MRRYLRRFPRQFPSLGDLSVAIGLIVLIVTSAGVLTVSKNGVVCNRSSADVWITVSEIGGRAASVLEPGHCTNVFLQDAEAIWGRACETRPCSFQAWKVGAGHFEVHDHGDSLAGPVLQIRGWGVGSRWHITWDWDRPELSTISYSLSR